MAEEKGRGLQFPYDARRAHDVCLRGLEADASLARVGRRVALGVQQGMILPAMDVIPEFGRSAREDDEAVLREVEALLGRFAVTAMISRFEGFAQNLLLQRRFVEALLRQDKLSMSHTEFLQTFKRVQNELRSTSLALLPELIVQKPSSELAAKTVWLKGFYAIRKCLIHRQGIVQMEDVGDGYELRVAWPGPRTYGAGVEIERVPHEVPVGHGVESRFETRETVWKVGEVIRFTSRECQFAAFAISQLATQLLVDFEVEMTPRTHQLDELSRAGSQSE